MSDSKIIEPNRLYSRLEVLALLGISNFPWYETMKKKPQYVYVGKIKKYLGQAVLDFLNKKPVDTSVK